mgnify:CR=1 FL=1|jgi:16S rRNA (adenine1518-N6/adenine1519-N6)-dimethyltransferase|tara:strand:+ start:452 stop:1249 length:798 start_codon:yes stop_codon:yes gene_type:complete
MIKPKKSLGQNFLIDNNIINKIIALADISGNNILEIGPGTGNLTSQIIKHNPSSLTLIEKDKKIFEKLKNEIELNGKLSIFNDDILKFDVEKNMKENSIVFGNLPYNISTQILVKLIKFKKWPPKFNKLILMFQKEVGEKILATHNTKDYGRLSIISNWRLEIIEHFDVSKNCFFPKPKVESIVLVFKPKIIKKYKIKNIENIENITRIFFSNKRKMINKSFKKIFEDVEYCSKKLKIDLSFRPSQLSKNDYYKIVEYFEKYVKN